MLYLLFLLLMIGLLGVLGMTWLFPVLAQFSSQENSKAAVQNLQPQKLSILIPAYNEESTLGHTLDSFITAKKTIQQRYPDLDIQIVVGANGCTDSTIKVAAARGVIVLEEVLAQGKWRTLERLVEFAKDSDWIALADAGVLWPENFLEKILPVLCESKLIGALPTYRNPAAGNVEELLWNFERHLKSLESRVGGPVSSHGATSFFRGAELFQAMSRLSGTNWLNDDVVLPLTLRGLFPNREIRYLPEIAVYDQAGNEKARTGLNQYKRRERMVLGNIQWIRAVLPEIVGKNQVAALLALRRCFRVFWACWGVVCLVALMLMCGLLFGSKFVGISIALGALPAAWLAYSARSPLRDLMDAAQASLSAPYFLFSSGSIDRAVWK